MNDFRSDANASAHPAVMAALVAANEGHMPGDDDGKWSDRAAEVFQAAFGPKAVPFFVASGTGSNVTALRSLIRSYEAVICSDVSHIHVNECAAFENSSGGKLFTANGTEGKLDTESVAPLLDARGDQHRAQPRVVSLTQATERGSVYSLDEMKAIGEFARSHDLFLHVDGARFSNAVASLGTTLRAASADVGVDILSFGGLKNGGAFGEVIVVFDPETADRMKYVRKQGGQDVSKGRFVAAQFIALLENDLWRHNAERANAMASRLADGIRELSVFEIKYAVETNAVFASVSGELLERATPRCQLSIWNAKEKLVRWVTSFDTEEDTIDQYLDTLKRELPKTS